MALPPTTKRYNGEELKTNPQQSSPPHRLPRVFSNRFADQPIEGSSAGTAGPHSPSLQIFTALLRLCHSFTSRISLCKCPTLHVSTRWPELPNHVALHLYLTRLPQVTQLLWISIQLSCDCGLELQIGLRVPVGCGSTQSSALPTWQPGPPRLTNTPSLHHGEYSSKLSFMRNHTPS